MGLLERIGASRTETRIIGGVPWRPWDSPYWKFSQGGPIHPTRAFYGVDHALGLPALYSGAKLLADSVASLPIKIYAHARDGGRAVRYYGPSIFDEPSANGTIVDWLFTAMTSLVLQGNAWGFITGRDGYGYPTGIEWLPPEDVDCVDDEIQPWNPMRTRIYAYGRLMDKQDLFHVKAFSVAGRTEGISPLRAFALTILNGLEAQRYGTDWYQSGGFPPGTFQNNEIEISAEQAEDIREQLVASMRRRQPLVYGRDWDYKPVVVPPSEAQFIDAMRMNATMVAAVLGLPPDRIGGTKGDSLTYSTVEQSTLQVIEALRPWLVRLESAFFRLLPERRYCRFNSDALLKTDLKTRTDIYAAQRAMGMLNIDEIRDTEDMPPLPGGQGNENTPLEVMVAMARSIRAIPTSMLPFTTLEMDLAADRLQQLEKESPELVKPTMGQGVLPTAEQMYGSIVGSTRGAFVPGEDDADPAQTARDVELIMNFLADRAKARKGRTGPEYIGAWIPDGRELVLNGSGNGNGTGRH